MIKALWQNFKRMYFDLLRIDFRGGFSLIIFRIGRGGEPKRKSWMVFGLQIVPYFPYRFILLGAMIHKVRGKWQIGRCCFNRTSWRDDVRDAIPEEEGT